MNPQSNQPLAAAKPKLIVLLGPTSVGKTRLSLEIAKKFQCEIISGDSMQVYRGMDIGTAKATPDERRMIPHHLIDIREPDEPFSVTEFQDLAGNAVKEIFDRGHTPFIVGGTGLYIEAFCYGFEFSVGGMDERFRQDQAEYAEQYGIEALHNKLKQVDPESADRIHPNNLRRVIRALEIVHMTGITMTQSLEDQKRQSPYDLCLIGLTMDRELLYERIEQRIDIMLDKGLIQEVQVLLSKGYTRSMVSMQGLGYKEIIGYLENEYSLAEAVAMLKQSTRNYAKRQMSWFRHMKDIQWVDVTDSVNFSAYLNIISDIIAGKFSNSTEYN
ncbi:MAG TPA: tRNA (adenosine(37)-N6)-dimethylallyltransferase MiaA [Bacilli bacterium]